MEHDALSFLGKDIPIAGPLGAIVNGTLRLNKNWDYNLAFMGDPLYPKFDTTFRELLRLAAQQVIPPVAFKPVVRDLTDIAAQTADTQTIVNSGGLPPPMIRSSSDEDMSAHSKSSSAISAVEPALFPTVAFGATVSGGTVVSVAGLNGKKSAKKQQALLMLSELKGIKPEATKGNAAADTLATSVVKSGQW